MPSSGAFYFRKLKSHGPWITTLGMSTWTFSTRHHPRHLKQPMFPSRTLRSLNTSYRPQNFYSLSLTHILPSSGAFYFRKRHFHGPWITTLGMSKWTFSTRHHPRHLKLPRFPSRDLQRPLKRTIFPFIHPHSHFKRPIFTIYLPYSHCKRTIFSSGHQTTHFKRRIFPSMPPNSHFKSRIFIIYVPSQSL